MRCPAAAHASMEHGRGMSISELAVGTGDWELATGNWGLGTGHWHRGTKSRPACWGHCVPSAPHLQTLVIDCLAPHPAYTCSTWPRPRPHPHSDGSTCPLCCTHYVPHIQINYVCYLCIACSRSSGGGGWRRVGVVESKALAAHHGHDGHDGKRGCYWRTLWPFRALWSKCCSTLTLT